MREIKFDAIYKPTGLHVEVVKLNFNDNTITYRDENGDCDWCHFSLDGKYGDVILRQFTGLHDKNGKEIYEGDIVQVTEDPAFGGEDDFVGVVKFYECAYWIDNEPQEIACQLFNEITEHEVIGNIYETPELLEKAS